MTQTGHNQSKPADVSSTGNPVSSGAISMPSIGALKLDIEHTAVKDDPRLWSRNRKRMVLLIVSSAAMIAGLSTSIQNPANSQIQHQLHTTASQISFTMSFFVLVHGNFPLIWSAVSELKGRKLVYLFSTALFTLGSAIVALSNTIGLVIGMRVLQAAGSSAVVSIGAATLADVYEPHERGSVMGVYLSAPLLGPSMGSILGGAICQAFGWRAVFWFLVIWGSVIFGAFLFFKDTFRKERSLAFQLILRKQERMSAKENDATRRASEKTTQNDGASGTQASQTDVEAQTATGPSLVTKEVKVTIADINPLPPYIRVLSRKNNVAILIPSGLIFGFVFVIPYTCARTLSQFYGYGPMKIGLVLLAFGLGCMLGSVSGGRWSDRTLARLKIENGGFSYPEMRLESTKVIMLFFPPAILGYAWVCQQQVHVSAVCVMLFLCGFFSTWTYGSTLAYIVDANAGQSSSAAATNSSFRGTTAFIATQIAVPLQDAIGDGGLYSLWAGCIVVGQLLMLLVIYKGKKWREASIEAEKQGHK